MESSVVFFKPRIHLFACIHPSDSISLVCNDWLAYKHQSTALVQARGSLLYTSISLHPVFQTCLDWVYLFAYTHQSPALSFKRVWMVILQVSISSPVFQIRLDYGYLSVYTHLTPTLCSNTFELRFFVCVTHPSTATCSNTFVCGCSFVYKHQS